MNFIHSVRHYFERHGYHVSSRLADRLGMRAKNVRLFFIYISFVTVGLSFGFYLIIAFLLKLKDIVHTKRSSVFDLWLLSIKTRWNIRFRDKKTNKKTMFKSKFRKALLLLISVLLIGVFGYMVISGYSFVNALYMTVITVSTVGFGEISPLNEQEKLFTIFLITISIISFGYTVSAFTEYIISGQLFQQLKLKKMQKKIDQLSGHTIICGFGRNGKQSMIKLQNYKKDFVIVEQADQVINEIDLEGFLNIKGDATTDEALLKAGIGRADNLITALPSDADNLFVVLSARQLNTNCRIISRASNESSYSKLKIAGANNVIMPDKLGGDHMASLVVTPDVIEFVGRLTIEGETTANLEEISVNDLPTEYLNKTILDLDLRKKTGCTVIGFKAPDNSYIINPEASIKLQNNSHLIVLGRPEQISKLRLLF